MGNKKGGEVFYDGVGSAESGAVRCRGCARGRTVAWGLVRGWGTAGSGEIESAVGVGRKRGVVAYFNSLPFFCKSFMQSR